jgi:hypothetical protein
MALILYKLHSEWASCPDDRQIGVLHVQSKCRQKHASHAARARQNAAFSPYFIEFFV